MSVESPHVRLVPRGHCEQSDAQRVHSSTLPNATYMWYLAGERFAENRNKVTARNEIAAADAAAVFRSSNE